MHRERDDQRQRRARRGAPARARQAKAPVDPHPLFVAATASYAANCALGTAVATGRLHTGRAHWVHHALYICTSALAAAAATSLLWSRSRAGWALLPAAIPLIAIPSVSARTRGHVGIALSAAPFFVGALVASARGRRHAPKQKNKRKR
ncbi:hypothetical protein ACFJGV_18720 [Cnuibacter sp. UC19_7]|uniref:hypothetical protein n=1 Tax=Cnuibacter sp. UC19_7 TaxID=3350166 RepID=UPI00366D0087